MKVITTLSIMHTNHAAKDRWPHVATHVVVVVWQPEHAGHLLAIGVEPEHHQIVFEAELPPAKLGVFLKAVIDSERSEAERHCQRIAPPSPAHHAYDAWPLVFKASLALARALRSDAVLAEAVVNPAPPRPPRPPCEPPIGKQR